ncbi:MAG: NADH-quinone oxidoreductase subunit N [Elusimicrobia bacterium]|nr:NADH-quinone oxidoreductase subunit N [Elusimicrobiota bacterium]
MNLAQFFAPEISVALAALGLLTLDFMAPNRRSLMNGVAYAGLFLAALSAPFAFKSQPASAFFGLDSLTAGFGLLVLVGTLVAVVMSQEDESLSRNWGSYLGLLMSASLGCLMLLKSRDFIFAFVAVELISISSFILVAFERRELALIEGALKYFLVGAFSSAIALYGISLYYTAAGTTEFSALGALSANKGAGVGVLMTAGLLLVFVSFGFKASLAPFHFWVPDAYQSAPTPFTAYLSVVPKVATLGLLALLMTSDFGGGSVLTAAALGPTLGVLACLTMTVGNVSAIAQNNMKRLLAYSSVAQAGYMLIGVLAASKLGSAGLVLYGFAYLFMNLGAFACVQWIEKSRGTVDITACDGLSLSRLPFALAFTAFLLSLAGIPPLVGFLAKYVVFASALEAHWVWVAVVGVLNSVISVYYYLRIAYRMFFIEEPGGAEALDSRSGLLPVTIILLLAGTVLLGLYPKPLLALVNF